MLRYVKLLLCSFASLIFSLRLLAHLLYRLNCHVDKQPVVGICSSLDSGLLATAMEVSKSYHNSTIKPLMLSLHCIAPNFLRS